MEQYDNESIGMRIFNEGKQKVYNDFGGENIMDECCMDFCKNLDEWIVDEQKSTKEYHNWALKARKNDQVLIGTILESLSIDENKHADALKDIWMLVCKTK